ncbi:sugar ABC transporter substrate-binding protein [Dokdonella sp.]|uniref:sugar ABC transporter substrate-binding protein n=1 Tax=Dokdonella sp. TaxID=2291710 RepID=UPI001B0AD859|nr:sugar ABC transporter substrate-binding protein [Dokdonella sp.]MBO9662805.1 sugar ABC transporter substrate-binding protein [Dokdonella sp.]
MPFLAACARSEPNVTVLKFWAVGREAEVVPALLADFEREHPGLRVEVQALPLTAAHEKFLTAFAGDALPDVAQLGNTWLPELATLGALEPLQERVDASPVVRQDDYFPGIWDTNVIDGRLYGVPWYVDTRLLFYRKDLLAQAGFAEPPRDWDEWRQALAAIKRNAGPDKYAILLPLNEYEPLLNLAVQMPDPLLRERDTRGNFESAGFRRAFEFYLDMFQQDWAPPMSATQISNVWDEFAKGFYAFYITGPWNVGEFRRRLPAELQDDWGTAPLPGPDGPGAAVGGGSSLVMFASSARKPEVWQLIEFLSAPEQQRRLHELCGDLPPRRSSWNAPALADDRYARAFRDQLERVKPTPKIPEWERIAQELRLAAERAVRGREPLDQVLPQLDARTDAILDKRRWMLAHEAAR